MSLQILSPSTAHSEVLEVRTSTYEFRGDMLHPVTSGLSTIMASDRNEIEGGTASAPCENMSSHSKQLLSEHLMEPSETEL